MSLKKLVTAEEVKNIIYIMNNIYDSVRLINPLKKKIITVIDGTLSETPYNCYDIWPDKKICNNCISMRAFNEKDIFIKLDWADNKIYMIMAIPIQNESETIVLELFKDVTGSMTVETSGVTDKAAILQALSEIGQQQIRDSLTGLFNRRFIDERLQVDISNNVIESIPYAIIFADIDYFKHVNDTYGHVAGDHVLKEFAAILQKSIEDKNGWTARYGGEEFLVYLENENAASVSDFAENLRLTVQNSEFEYDGNIIKITSSFGAFVVGKNLDVVIEDLIEHADKNLYAAKSSGRNKVITSELQ